MFPGLTGFTRFPDLAGFAAFTSGFTESFSRAFSPTLSAPFALRPTRASTAPAAFAPVLAVTLAIACFRVLAGARCAGFAAALRALAAATAASATVATAAFTAFTAFASFGALAGAGFAFVFGFLGNRRRRRCGCRCRAGGGAAKQAFEPRNKAFFSHRRRRYGLGRGGRRARLRRWLPGLDRFGRFGHDGGRHIGQYALDDRLLLVVFFLAATGDGGWVLELFGRFVAGGHAVKAGIVMLEALELVVGRLQGLVGHQHHRDTLLHLDLGDLAAFLIEQEGCHLDWHLAVNCGGVVLEGVFLNDAQDLQRRAFGIADVAGAAATGAGDGSAFGEGRAQALAAHLEQTEFADRAELNPGAVLAQGVA